MFANLVAYNNAGRGKISQGSVEYHANDPEDVIQLRIGEYQYIFDNTGKLQDTSKPQTCINFNEPKFTCDSFSNRGTCIPTFFKTED
jgi:hypothetical protein